MWSPSTGWYGIPCSTPPPGGSGWSRTMAEVKTAAPARARGVQQPEVLLEIKDVRQTYAKGTSGDLLVLDGVNLTLKAGEIVGLLGRSGSGKSSLLRIIAGLVRPVAGEVCWRGRPLRGASESIAMVFQ